MTTLLAGQPEVRGLIPDSGETVFSPQRFQTGSDTTHPTLQWALGVITLGGEEGGKANGR